MYKMSYVKRSMIAAVCIALCVVLPMAFHAIHNAGRILLPMHIPVLLAGLICGWPLGFLVGLVGPFLATMFTGMPPMAIMPRMMVELATFGLVTGLVMQFIRTKNTYADLYISLIAGMLAGRIIAGFANALIFFRGSYAIAMWVTSYFVNALPGIIVQIILLPSIVFALEKARLIPTRYPNKISE